MVGVPHKFWKLLAFRYSRARLSKRERTNLENRRSLMPKVCTSSQSSHFIILPTFLQFFFIKCTVTCFFSTFISADSVWHRNMLGFHIPQDLTGTPLFSSALIYTFQYHHSRKRRVRSGFSAHLWRRCKWANIWIIPQLERDSSFLCRMTWLVLFRPLNCGKGTASSVFPCFCDSFE